MKKLFTFILLALILSSCSSKWDQSDPNMPDELRQQHEEVLEENLQTIEESEETNITALFEVAYRYHQLGDFLKAIDYYEQVLDYDVNHIVALNNMASLYEKVEEYELAADYIKRLYEVRQDEEEVIKDTVRILLKAGDAQNAEHALDNYESLVIDPENPDTSREELIQSLHADIDEWYEENQ